MNRFVLTTAAAFFAFGSIGMPTAFAAGAVSEASQSEQVRTRDRVRTELAEAVRTGDIMANNETGTRLNEQYPGLYPRKAVELGLTRERVRAELAEAVRTGDITGNNETGTMLNEQYPGLYPGRAIAFGATREQLRAELAEAVRAGNMMRNNQTGI